MGFDADMRKVTERYKKWADNAIITNDDFAYVDGLIQRHYDDRARLFDELQNALKRDKDIQSPWDNLCDKGVDLTERLNSEISRKVPSGLVALGMDDFYGGEKETWKACKDCRIGLIAEAMVDIGQSDVEIFKKLEEDLKRAREDEKIVAELSRVVFTGYREEIRALIAQLAGAGAAAGIAASHFLDPDHREKLAGMAKKFVTDFITGNKQLRELAKKKKVAKQILEQNMELVDKARDKIADGAIRDLLKRTEELAADWKNHSDGDYKAEDWDYLGRACIEILRNKAAPIIDKAKLLYVNMVPLYEDALKTSFITLFSDPSTIENFTGQVDEDFQKLLEGLAKEQSMIDMLRDSVPKRSANELMKDVVQGINETLRDTKDAIREADEALRR